MSKPLTRSLSPSPHRIWSSCVVPKLEDCSSGSEARGWYECEDALPRISGPVSLAETNRPLQGLRVCNDLDPGMTKGP